MWISNKPVPKDFVYICVYCRCQVTGAAKKVGKYEIRH